MERVKEAIERGDAAALRALVEEDASAALEPIVWGPDGKNRVPPLHYVCDVRFQRRIDAESSRALADALLEAGVDPNEAYARSGDTYLIAAASLSSEEVGLRLLERGADVHARGLFGATALHWAADGGLVRLVDALLGAGADAELRDAEHGATPLDWAKHRGADPQPSPPGLDDVIARLERP